MLYTYRRDEYFTKYISLIKKYELLEDDKGWYYLLKKYADEVNPNINTNFFKDRCEKEYGFNFCEMAYRCYVKYLLWTKEFCKDKDCHVLIKAGVLFNVFCCIVDKILDDPDAKVSRETALNMVEWNYIGKYYNGEIFENKSSVMGCMMNYMSNVFQRMKDVDKGYHAKIVENIHMALTSEVYISTYDLSQNGYNDIDEDLLINKSIKYVIACQQIGGFLSNDRARMDRCAVSIAEAFWLTDDLNDVYEDISNGVPNSLICKYAKNNDINTAMDMLINDLEKYVVKLAQCLEIIKENSNDKIFKYYKYEISVWLKDAVYNNV